METKKQARERYNKQDRLFRHYHGFEGLSYEDAEAKRDSFGSGDALNAEYERIMAWDRDGYSHQIDGAVYDRLKAIGHAIKTLEDLRDKERLAYQKEKGITADHLWHSISNESHRRAEALKT